MKISESSKEKQTTSIRISKHIWDTCKEYEVPIGVIAEAGLIYFLKLSDDSKIKFLSENLPDMANIEDIKTTTKWTELFSKYLKDSNLPKSSITSIISSAALLGTAVSIIALLLKGNSED